MDYNQYGAYQYHYNAYQPYSAQSSHFNLKVGIN
jgi:hypothetical protein